MNARPAAPVRGAGPRERLRRGLCVALLATAALYNDASRAEPVRCRHGAVRVHAAAPAEAAAACDAASQAQAFFDANGLGRAGPIEIHLVSRLPIDAAEAALGCYDRRDQQIYVLDLATCRGRGRLFDLPVDGELHRSIIVHEVAHATAAHNFAAARPSLAAQEYIAAVTQLASLSPDARARILARYPGSGFQTHAQITSTMFMLDPTHFAVQAYRHYLQPENGAAFLRRLLTGEPALDD